MWDATECARQVSYLIPGSVDLLMYRISVLNLVYAFDLVLS